MNNLELWNKVSRPPREALKQIKGGRLSGMTDVNPQWRFKAMTEQFGPCGKGWRYEIDHLWHEQGTDGQVVAFARVSLYVGENEHPIPGIGGSMLIQKETAGLRTNDEAYKMAVTDALSVAMKALGVAADIYAGLWDGTKYRDAPTEVHKPTDGAWSRVKPERQQVVRDTLTQVMDALNEERDFDAYGLCETLTDADEKVALWGELNSKQRSRLKEAKNAETLGA